MVIVLGILCFSVAAVAMSWAVGKRARTSDAGETSLLVLLVSWSALLFGMYMARFV